jgi:hypothetical protein
LIGIAKHLRRIVEEAIEFFDPLASTSIKKST